MQTPTWLTWNEEDAKLGMLVGFNNETDPYDLTMTGVLSEAPRFTKYQTVISGTTFFINNLGVVMKTVPAGGFVGRTVRMVTYDMEMSEGTQQAMTRGVADEYESVADISALEPRDEFAMTALSAMMNNLKGCEAFDDARIFAVCQQAYKWAQGMMLAAANARALVKKPDEEPAPSGPDPEPDPEEPDEEMKEHLPVNPKAITDMSDKLLYNLGIDIQNLRAQQANEFKRLKNDGLMVVGSDDEESVPVKVQFPNDCEMTVKLPDDYQVPVTIEDEVKVEIQGTPDVNVTNTPDVHVNNMPSVPTEPVSITGTVSVDNFPESSSNSSNS